MNKTTTEKANINVTESENQNRIATFEQNYDRESEFLPYEHKYNRQSKITLPQVNKTTTEKA